MDEDEDIATQLWDAASSAKDHRARLASGAEGGAGDRRQLARTILPSWPWLLIAETFFALVLVAGLFGDGLIEDFAFGGIDSFPLVILAQLALVASSQRWARIATSLWLALLIAMMMIFAIGGTGMTVETLAGKETDADAEMGAAFAIVTLGWLMTFILLKTPLRALLRRVVPFDARQPIHRAGLWVALMTSTCLFTPLIVTGEPFVLALIKRGKLAELLSETERQALFQQLFGLMWLIPATFLAAGAWLTRSPAETLERLGLMGWTYRQLLAALLMGVLLALLAGFIVDPGIARLWTMAGWPTTDLASTEQLFSQLLTPAGIVVASVSAGIGEELALRGLLQPRLGVWLSNLLFVSLHSFQYHWDALVAMFLLSLVEAFARKRYNTVVCIGIHVSYDLTAFFALLVR